MIVCWLAIRGWQTPFQVIFAKIPLKPDNHPNYLIFHPKFLKTKKIGCLTTTDFQKTNYLKTNLLKQIKKISFRSLRFISFGMQSYRLIFIRQKKYLIFFAVLCKKNKKKDGSTSHPYNFDMSGLHFYIIPPIPGAPPIGIAGFSSGLSTIRHSVVRNMPAIEAAFSRATRATLAGSMTPHWRKSS